MGDRPYLSRHALDRFVAIGLVMLTFGLQWYRHATFRSNTYDLAVFEQVVWKMAHGLGATSSLTAWNTFGDHLSPILLVFVPLYRIAATPLWFFAAQSLAVGVGVLCIRPLVVAAGGDGESRATTLLIGAYVVNPAVWNAVLFDFHTTTLAIPVLLLGCIAALRHKHRDLWLVMGALILLRDDLALAGVAMAVVGWTADTRTGRRWRAAIVGAGVAWTLIGAQVGTALGASRHFVARYGYLGSSMTGAATHPAHAIVGAVTHLFAGDNVFPVLALLLPLALLPLGRPRWFALGIFVALPTLLATDANLHSPAYQYAAPIVPFMFLAAAGTLARFDAATIRRAVFVMAPLATATFFLIGPLSTGVVTMAGPNPSDVRAALRTIKPSDVVVATGFIGAHVADRNVLLPFPFPLFDATHNFPLDPRVTSTALSKRETVTVVVVAPSGRENSEVIDHFVDNPSMTAHFTKQSFGRVDVFRRIGT